MDTIIGIRQEKTELDGFGCIERIIMTHSGEYEYRRYEDGKTGGLPVGAGGYSIETGGSLSDCLQEMLRDVVVSYEAHDFKVTDAWRNTVGYIKVAIRVMSPDGYKSEIVETSLEYYILKYMNMKHLVLVGRGNTEIDRIIKTFSKDMKLAMGRERIGGGLI